MSINVGDAVQYFTADTTQLDQAYQRINRGSSALSGADRQVQQLDEHLESAAASAAEAGEQIEESGQRAKASMGEARGEIALLGEGIGVQLPRHVRSFVAELPGVGTALEAAFSATAVLFVLEAVVQVTEKVSAFAAELFYSTSALKETEEAIGKENEKLAELNRQYTEAKERVEAFGKSALEAAQDRTKVEQKSVEELTKELGIYQRQLAQVQQFIIEHPKHVLSLTESYEQWRAGTLTLTQAFKGYLGVLDTAEQKEKELNTLNADVTETGKKQQIAIENLTNAKQKEAKATAEETEKQRTAVERLRELQQKLSHDTMELAIAQDRLNRTATQGMGDQAQLAIDTFPPIVQQVLAAADAYRTLGITSQEALSQRVGEQRAAVQTITTAYLNHVATLKDVRMAELALLQTEEKQATLEGKNTDSLKKREVELKKLIGVEEQHGRVAKQVADQVGSAILQEGFAYGQGTITATQALRQLTSVIIQEIAKQAEVKGAAKLAEALGEVFHNPAAAAGDFAAATAWFALAGGISAAAGAVAGSSATPGTAANPISTQSSSPVGQTQQTPVSVVNTQRLAGGGLISEKTLAVIGDSITGGSAREAVIPLDDPKAASAISDALGGSQGDVHVHVKGVISADNLNKVVKKMARGINNGSARFTINQGRKIIRNSKF